MFEQQKTASGFEFFLFRCHQIVVEKIFNVYLQKIYFPEDLPKMMV